MAVASQCRPDYVNAMSVLKKQFNITVSIHSFVALYLLIIVLTSSFARTPQAANANLPKAELTLINAGVRDGVLLAGVEIAIEPHIKTYWRMPGDSGLPPVFDWSRSENLASAIVRWPKPERIQDPSGTILGYYDDVIFPVEVLPKDAKKPVHLVLKLDYAVCGDLCVPLTGDADVTLTGLEQIGPNPTRVNAFLARVPKSVPFGYTTTSVSQDPNMPDALLVSVKEPLTDLIVEGPEGWYFGDAKPISPSLWRIFVLQHPTSTTLSSKTLIFTFISNTFATETTVTLDATGSIR